MKRESQVSFWGAILFQLVVVAITVALTVFAMLCVFSREYGLAVCVGLPSLALWYRIGQLFLDAMSDLSDPKDPL